MNWVKYRNGNYDVLFDLKTGTKIRKTEDDEFIPAFSECCDVHISDCCDNGCEMCYADCTKDGRFADLINQEWIETLHQYTELALNVQMPVHPDLVSFLRKLKEKKIVTNITVNQNHFMKLQDGIQRLLDEHLIYGLGVSLVDPTDEFIKTIKRYPTAVIHVIAGVVTEEQINKLKGNNLKLLVLGYKSVGRGVDYALNNCATGSENINWLSKHIIFSYSKDFDVISFDNLAIEQLIIQSQIPEEKWEKYYQGDDGDFTFFIDMVNKTFSKNSIALRGSENIHPIMSNIDDMFKVIRDEVNKCINN